MKIIKTKKKKVSRWVSLIENILVDKKTIHKYQSIKIDDYVCVLALNKEKEVLLVEQFRPAVNKKTLELPGGIVRKNEKHIDVAKTELLEETGYRVLGRLKKLGRIDIDYGRISNNAYGFFADNIVYDEKFKTEDYIKTLKLPLSQFISKVKKNEFSHSPHLSFVLLARLKKLI